MKLGNLIEALDSMMNLGADSIMSIIDEAGNEMWKGRLGEFDKTVWFSRDIIMWSYTDALKSVIILVDWRQ